MPDLEMSLAILSALTEAVENGKLLDPSQPVYHVHRQACELLKRLSATGEETVRAEVKLTKDEVLAAAYTRAARHLMKSDPGFDPTPGSRLAQLSFPRELQLH